MFLSGRYHCVIEPRYPLDGYRTPPRKRAIERTSLSGSSCQVDSLSSFFFTSHLQVRVPCRMAWRTRPTNSPNVFYATDRTMSITFVGPHSRRLQGLRPVSQIWKHGSPGIKVAGDTMRQRTANATFSMTGGLTCNLISYATGSGCPSV